MDKMNKDEDILFTIIVPVYNTEKYLFQKCIKSIQSLTYRNFECLIIDDGSVKKCADMLDSLCTDDRIRVIHIKHRGNSFARNLGIEEADGEFLLFADSDDMVIPGLLDEAYHIIKEHDPDMAIGLVRSFKDKNMDLDSFYNMNKQHFVMLKGKEDMAEMVNHILGCRSERFEFSGGYVSGGPVAKVIRTSIAKISKFPKGDLLTEDVVWNCNLMSNIESAVITSKIWYAYYHYPESKSRRFYKDGQDKFNKQAASYWNICKKLWPENEQGLYIKLWQELAMYFRTYLGHPDNKKSWKRRYNMFKAALKKPEYAEMMANIDFSYDNRKAARFMKEFTLFCMRYGFYLPAWFIWKKVSEKSL